MRSLLRHVLLLATASVFTAASAFAIITPTGPDISNQPKPLIVAAGSSATFSVTATGTGTLKYQWQLGTGNITGATKSTYTITKVTPNNMGNYRVIVSQTVNKVVTSTTSDPALLTVNSNYAGKYNMAVIEYNAADVQGDTQLNGESSGNALYGTSTVTGTTPFYTVKSVLNGYLGNMTTGGLPQTKNGNITGGALNINGTSNTFTWTLVKGNDTITPIGFIGKGTPLLGSDNTNDGFVIGLNATTTAPTSAAACAGTYTVIIISYSATAVSKGNPNLNGDGDAAIGNVTVTSSGAFTVTQYRYADGGNDTLGKQETITGTVSSSGTVSSVTVHSNGNTIIHPISLKFVTLNGQVIGFTGTFKPISGADNSGILIGIRGLYPPLDTTLF